MHRKITALILVLQFLLPISAHAARLNTIGMELNTLTAGVEWDFNGLFSATTDGATTTRAHAGNFSLHFNDAAVQFSWMASKYRSAATAASTTIRVYVYLNQVFAAAQEIFTIANEGPGALYSLKLDTSNNLCMYDSRPLLVGSCASITTGEWHYVEVDTNGAGVEIGRLDGVQFAASTTVVGGAVSRVYLGCAFTGTGCKQDAFYDDLAINDSTGSSQTNWPGAGNSILYVPNGAGSVNLWHKSNFNVGDSTNFQSVYGVPPRFVSLLSTTTISSDFYTVVASTTISSGSTINVVQVLTQQVRAGATAGAFKAQIKKTSGGTISLGSAITPTAATTTSTTTAPFIPSLTLYNDPDGAAWTSTTIASMQIGATTTTAGANGQRLSGVWAYVDYVPPAAIVVPIMLARFRIIGAMFKVVGASLIIK